MAGGWAYDNRVSVNVKHSITFSHIRFMERQLTLTHLIVE